MCKSQRTSIYTIFLYSCTQNYQTSGLLNEVLSLVPTWEIGIVAVSGVSKFQEALRGGEDSRWLQRGSLALPSKGQFNVQSRSAVVHSLLQQQQHGTALQQCYSRSGVRRKGVKAGWCFFVHLFFFWKKSFFVELPQDRVKAAVNGSLHGSSWQWRL